MLRAIYKNRRSEFYLSKLCDELNSIIREHESSLVETRLSGKTVVIGDAHGSLLQVIFPLLETGLIKNFKLTNKTYSFDVDESNTSKVVFLGDVFAKSQGFDCYLLSGILIDIIEKTHGKFEWLIGNHDAIQFWYEFAKMRYQKNGLSDFYNLECSLISENGDELGTMYNIDFIKKFTDAVSIGLIKVATMHEGIVYSHTVLNREALSEIIFSTDFPGLLCLTYENIVNECYEDTSYIAKHFDTSPEVDILDDDSPEYLVKLLNESFLKIVKHKPFYLLTDIPYLWDRPVIELDDNIYIYGYLNHPIENVSICDIVGKTQTQETQTQETQPHDMFSCPHVIGHTNAIKRCILRKDIGYIKFTLRQIIEQKSNKEFVKAKIDKMMTLFRMTKTKIDNLIFADSQAVINRHEIHYLINELDLFDEFDFDELDFDKIEDVLNDLDDPAEDQFNDTTPLKYGCFDLDFFIESPCCYVIEQQSPQCIELGSFDMSGIYL